MARIRIAQIGRLHFQERTAWEPPSQRGRRCRAGTRCNQLSDCSGSQLMRARPGRRACRPGMAGPPSPPQRSNTLQPCTLSTRLRRCPAGSALQGTACRNSGGGSPQRSPGCTEWVRARAHGMRCRLGSRHTYSAQQTPGTSQRHTRCTRKSDWSPRSCLARMACGLWRQSHTTSRAGTRHTRRAQPHPLSFGSCPQRKEGPPSYRQGSSFPRGIRSPAWWPQSGSTSRPDSEKRTARRAGTAHRRSRGCPGHMRTERRHPLVCRPAGSTPASRGGLGSSASRTAE